MLARIEETPSDGLPSPHRSSVDCSFSEGGDFFIDPGSRKGEAVVWWQGWKCPWFSVGKLANPWGSAPRIGGGLIGASLPVPEQTPGQQSIP